ncbi:MAG: molybdopterin dinucleotide binding domain-containing protein, partial [Pseudomonadota bacterium]
HSGFDLTAWQLCDETLKRSGLPDAAQLLDKHWHDCSLPFEQTNFIDGFANDDGRFHFKPQWSRLGPRHQNMPTMPTHWEVTDTVSNEYPLRLVAAPARQFLNTTFTETETSVKKEQRPTLLMHPDDLQALQIPCGRKVSVSSQCGSIRVHAKSFDGLQRGTVVMESIWPNSAFSDGYGVNTLVSAEPGYPNGGAVFHDTAVRVTSI